MPIVQFPSAQIFPTIPRTANFAVGASVQNTWYTVLATTAGQGKLTRILFGYNPAVGGTWGTNRFLELRLTIDGVQNTINTTFDSVIRGSHQQFVYNNNGGMAIDTFLYVPEVYFRSSLQIEIRQTSAIAGYNLAAAADYSLV